MSDKSETPNGRRRPSGSVVINRAMYEQLVQERERFRADLAAVTRERDEAKMELKRHFPIGKYDGLDIEQWKDRAERAEAKLAEAEKDARRLDWCALELEIDQIGEIDIHEQAADISGRDEPKDRHYCAAFRAAIDKAMEAGRE